ncbi:MAG: hypothetical protein ACR2J8_10725, partial [Thermomicrobiales bacterium]
MNRRAVLAAGIAAAGAVSGDGGRVEARPKSADLILIQDQQPTYGSTPTPGGTLAMYRPTGSSTDFNPASFAMDYQ